MRVTVKEKGDKFFHSAPVIYEPINEDIFTYNETTGFYDGFCATRACSIPPGGWVQMEHWDYFVGTLLAENIGTWIYEELRDDVVFQARTFD